jgi:hypothetical protein
LVAVKVRERLAVSKRDAQKIDMERFNLKNLYEEEVKEQYLFTIRSKSAVLENVEDSDGINRACDNMRENIKISAQESLGYCELKHGLIRKVQNWLIKGRRLNYSDYRTQMK